MAFAWLLRLLTLVLLGIAVLRVALVWDRLPDSMASHFSADGVPNAWSSRESFFLCLAIVGGGVTLLLSNIAVLVGRLPRSIVNLPHKEYWATDARWPVALERMAVWMAWFALATAALLLWVLELTLRANMARGPLPGVAMWTSLGVYLGFVVAWLAVLYRQFRPPP